MINRIVKMCFDPKLVDEFLQVFNQNKDAIANFEGCRGLTLLRSEKENNVLFTYSLWDNETCLNHYRYSELFKNTWAKTKVLFIEKPEAWSLKVEQEVK